MFNNVDFIVFLFFIVVSIILLIVSSYLYYCKKKSTYPFLVERNVFMKMTNNGDDLCDCNETKFVCSNYSEGIDIFIKKD